MPGPEENQVSPTDPELPPPPAQEGPTTETTDPENPDPDPPLRQPPPRQPPNESGGCCKNRSILEKCLLGFLLIVFLLFVAFLIGFIILYYWKSEPRAYCMDDNCVQSAAKINAFMDHKADPCEDFYQYACGAWIRDTVIPEDKPEITVHVQMMKHAREDLKKELEKDSTYKDLLAVQKARDFYSSCMNSKRLESLGSGPFEKLVASVGKWPSLDASWNETDFDLEDLLLSISRTRDFAMLPILSPQLKPDFGDTTKYAVYIEQGHLGMENASRELYVEGQGSRQLQAYQTMLQSLLEQLGADTDTARQDARDVVDFEIQLANISLSKEQLESTLYEVTSTDELESKYPDFDWANFMNGLVQYGSSPHQITSSDRIILTSPSYLDKLFPLLDSTPHRVKANYLMSSLWRHAAHISEPFRDIIKQYYKDLHGVESQTTRWETCVQLTDDAFPEVTGRLFVESTFGREQRDSIVKLVASLKSVFIDIIHQTDWMTETSKDEAEEKANALKARVGYPDYLMDDNHLTEKYMEYNMSRTLFFENSQRVAYLKNLNKVVNFRQPVDEDTWSFSAASAKAYYDAKSNELVFPAGFVQPPVYDSAYPSSMNYGGIGSFIGREITHGFDDTGRFYDKEGQARQWWTPADVENFEKQTECMVNHYSCFRWKPAKLNIDGSRTLGENVADNGGLKQSYRAYRHWVEQQGLEERMLPGLNLTHNQLFFISFAQLWCTNDRDDYKVHKIQTDTFTPAPFRVRGALQNSRDFAEAFYCRQGSAMNPQKKCEVW